MFPKYGERKRWEIPSRVMHQLFQFSYKNPSDVEQYKTMTVLGRNRPEKGAGC